MTSNHSSPKPFEQNEAEAKDAAPNPTAAAAVSDALSNPVASPGNPGVFNYGAVDVRTANLARKAADRIRSSLQAHSKVRFAIGRELRKIKKTLPHGLFEPWIEAEFGWSLRTAQRYMRLVEAFGPKSDSLSLMATSALHQLAARSTPSHVRSA